MNKILFTGTTILSAFILLKLIKKRIIHKIITKKDNTKKRMSVIEYTDIKKIALLYNTELQQPKKLTDIYFLMYLKKIKIIVILVLGYGELFPTHLIKIPKYGCFNLHTSLLPKYKGPTPIQEIIKSKETKGGITFHLMNNTFDTGPILLQKKLDIHKNETSKTLEKRIAHLTFKTFKKFTVNIKKKNLQIMTQQHYFNTKLTKQIKKNDAKINWNDTTENIITHIKTHQIKNIAYTIHKNKKIKIFNTSLIENEKISKKAGAIYIKDNTHLCVYTKNSVLKIDKIKIESQKTIIIDKNFCKHNKFFK